MWSSERINQRLEELRSPRWAVGCHELLAAPSVRERLGDAARVRIGVAICPNTRSSVRSATPELLPKAFREGGLSYDDALRLGARALAGLGEADRRVVFETLVPAHVPVLEAGWRMTAYRTIPWSGDRRLMVRSPRSADLPLLAGEWAVHAITVLGPLTADLSDVAPLVTFDDRWGEPDWSVVLAAAINAGGPKADALLGTLLSCVRGEHEVSGVSQAIIRTLVLCERPEAWEAVEKLLLAAQRQEGLRQSILESLVDCHPDVFPRFLRLILEHDLSRFSSVVRAADVWFGLLWDSASRKVIDDSIRSALGYIEDPGSREHAVRKGTPAQAYFALWAAGFEDIEVMLPLAARALDSKDPEVRFAAAHACGRARVEAVRPLLVRAIGDDDLRVAAVAADAFRYDPHGGSLDDDPTEPMDILPDAAEAGKEGVGEAASPSPVPARSEDASVFDALLGLLTRIPEKDKAVRLKAALWPWTDRTLKVSDIADVMAVSATAELAERMIPVVRRLSPRGREALAAQIGRIERWPGEFAGQPARPLSAAARAILLRFATDASAEVVETAVTALSREPLLRNEVGVLIGLLKRKASGVRTAAAKRLQALPDEALLDVAKKLLDCATTEQRAAGLEVLRNMAADKRNAEQARRVGTEWGEARGSRLNKTERTALELLTSTHADRPKRDDAFGLINPDGLTKPPPARPLGALRMTPAAWRCLADLATLVVKHKDLRLPTEDGKPMYDGETSVPLGSSGIPYGIARPEPDRSLESDLQRCPARELVTDWLASRSDQTKDNDGLELLRARLGLEAFRRRIGRDWTHGPKWPPSIESELKQTCQPAIQVSEDPIRFLLEWAARIDGDHGYAAALLDGLEHQVATSNFRASDDDADDDLDDEPDPNAPKPVDPDPNFPLHADVAHKVTEALDDFERRGVIRLNREHHARLWSLALAARPNVVRWLESLREKKVSKDEYQRSHASLNGIAPGERTIFSAVLAGGLSEDDLLDYAVHPYWSTVSGNVEFLTKHAAFEADDDSFPADDEPSRTRERFNDLERAARAHPVFVSAKHRLVERLIELEIQRGDAPTESSPFVSKIQHAGGADVLLRCLVALGKSGIKRTRTWREDSRQANLTDLIAATIPAERETPERFAELVRRAGFMPAPSSRRTGAVKAPSPAGLTEDALIDAAVYVPHWARHIDHALGEQWRGVEDAVWWIHAHTKGSDYRINYGIRQKWQASIAERTPLTEDELRDGAVDVDWFRRAYAALGPKRWARLDESAKYATSGAGHRRAQLFAAAMTGGACGGEKVTEKSLSTRIKSKRHQDSIRALGLVPIKKGPAGKKQVLERYKLMQEIRRTSRKHGGQLLQASERRAVEIGMENLARTAGYPDPLRLQWSMEREDLADLAKGPVTRTAGKGDKAVTVSLTIDADGAPELTVTRNGKPLASVPAAIKKDPKIARVTVRIADLRKALSRVRVALEEAMCRGDAFTGAELADLHHHPILRAMLARLVLVHAERPAIAGYPDKGGKVLRSHTGNLEPLKSADALRIAHPLDLLARKDWEKWQRECFAAERVQPFKQIFREVYVPTAEERASAESVKRYEGHQVNPRQALALLGSRQWVFRADESVQRTFHRERLTARLQFAEHFYTPAEVEGLTLEALEFTRAGEWKPLKVADVPPRLFSECMRDLDLVVSVAHRGGVDPEASRSTTAMRAAIVRETCALLKLNNVVIEGEHPEPASPDAKTDPKTKAAGKTRLPADPVRVCITGQLAEYTVHLGSAGVQVATLAGGKRVGGGSVWIIPVHAQHRGRLFLPFADDDPKTAEVVSKVLLLARDREIQDPSILSQIRLYVG
ncbi:MAG: DUF4132 domain-containing protein [Phycisphaeraceae bacterium]|nr:DUF4132 domain-containing protein [Phycisphaeraceae bacterium]